MYLKFKNGIKVIFSQTPEMEQENKLIVAAYHKGEPISHEGVVLSADQLAERLAYLANFADDELNIDVEYESE